jgi:putative membrane protein insertion efficiency factor
MWPFRFSQLPGLALIALARTYQRWISPLLGPLCRFHPSCSQYFIDAVRKYGAVRGTLKGLARLARCHPFSTGGFDPP